MVMDITFTFYFRQKKAIQQASTKWQLASLPVLLGSRCCITTFRGLLSDAALGGPQPRRHFVGSKTQGSGSEDETFTINLLANPKRSWPTEARA